MQKKEVIKKSMADMLVELIEKFIGGSEATLNSLFNSMVNLVFFIERELCIGMLKAVIVMICFKEMYYIFVGIVQEFLDSILSTMQIQGTNLAEMLTGNMGGGIFTAVACLILLIVWLILICQFIMKRNRNVSNETSEYHLHLLDC